MTTDPASYLQIYLTPLSILFARSDVTDIYINRPGEIWAETLGGRTERHEAPELTESALWRLARQVAAVTHQGVSREHPLLSARLPDGARMQFVAPPATRGSLAVAIRKHVSTNLSLEDYEASAAFHQTTSSRQTESGNELRHRYVQREWGAFLRAAVRARKTILISGGTSSGKTTFLNALLGEIPRDERLVVIEDTPELAIRHDNAIGLVAVRGKLSEAIVSTDDLLTASLRLRPDRIILGELRGSEAFTFLRAINTGHPGSLTTIHADSCERAITQLALLVMQSGTQLRWDDVVNYVTEVVDVVVQLERIDGVRKVKTIRCGSLDEKDGRGGQCQP